MKTPQPISLVNNQQRMFEGDSKAMWYFEGTRGFYSSSTNQKSLQLTKVKLKSNFVPSKLHKRSNSRKVRIFFSRAFLPPPINHDYNNSLFYQLQSGKRNPMSQPFLTLSALKLPQRELVSKTALFCKKLSTPTLHLLEL